MKLTKDNAKTELVRLREQHGITQAILSEKSGIRIETISRIETDKHSPSVMTLHALNKFFDNKK